MIVIHWMESVYVCLVVDPYIIFTSVSFVKLLIVNRSKTVRCYLWTAKSSVRYIHGITFDNIPITAFNESDS